MAQRLTEMEYSYIKGLTRTDMSLNQVKDMAQRSYGVVKRVNESADYYDYTGTAPGDILSDDFLDAKYEPQVEINYEEAILTTLQGIESALSKIAKKKRSWF